MSDNRPELRRHFEVDAQSIVIATLDALRCEGQVGVADVENAIKAFGLNPDKIEPLDV